MSLSDQVRINLSDRVRSLKQDQKLDVIQYKRKVKSAGEESPESVKLKETIERRGKSICRIRQAIHANEHIAKLEKHVLTLYVRSVADLVDEFPEDAPSKEETIFTKTVSEKYDEVKLDILRRLERCGRSLCWAVGFDNSNIYAHGDKVIFNKGFVNLELSLVDDARLLPIQPGKQYLDNLPGKLDYFIKQSDSLYTIKGHDKKHVVLPLDVDGLDCMMVVQ